MSSRFIALPVGQGDAFYLQRRNSHILVDGGRSIRSLPGLLKAHADPPRLDAVVCTHNDADHANGLIGLFEEQPVPVREVWLPGTWAWRFEDLVVHPCNFLKELENNIDEVRGRGDVETLEQYWEKIRSDTETSQYDRFPEQGADAGEWFLDIIDRQGVWPWEMDYGHPSFPGYCIPIWMWRRLWIKCLNSAHRIKSITEAALNAGARIRLFEFVKHGYQVRGGFSGCIEPVNSREVWPQSKTSQQLSALMYLVLTIDNRESLVFHAPERLNDNVPAVLFTADSDLAFNLNHVSQPSSNVVVTAPHHGSENNTSAYQTILYWAKQSDVLWVRSDCRSKSRPGSSFKSQPKRTCTLCNSSSAPKGAVRLHANRSRWQRTRGTRWCSCK